MIIGVPKEIKTLEFRVGLVPSSVKEFTSRGHRVIVETGAGLGIQASDADYEAAGAEIRGSAKEVFDEADMIVKVKEPQPVECEMLREDQLLFTYLHLAPDPKQAEGLIKSGAIAIAYETVTGPRGGLPLLAPMSEIAGRMSVHVGANYIHKAYGGLGRLLGGVPGVEPAEVVVIGGGVSGFNAARMAVGLGAKVTILERNPDKMRELDDHFAGRAQVIYSTVDSVERYANQADLLIGAVLIPGAAAPKLITRDMLKSMKDGSVVVDIAIDQGGCLETSKPTTHEDPIFEIDGVVHYCVANMPGAVPVTSAQALNNAVLPYAIKLAEKGWKQALLEDPGLRAGLNVCHGKITCEEVAESLNLDYTAEPPELAA